MRKVLHIIYLLSILTHLNCSSGWSVVGVQLTPADTIDHTVFIEIMDTNNIMHYYHERMYATQNWCYLHHEFEDVRKAND